MKKYYLVAEKEFTGNYRVFVHDSPNGREVLREFEAQNYSEACRKFSFSVRGMGGSEHPLSFVTAYCGVDVTGHVYHGETE